MQNYATVDFHAHPVTAAFRESLSNLGVDPINMTDCGSGFTVKTRSRF